MFTKLFRPTLAVANNLEQQDSFRISVTLSFYSNYPKIKFLVSYSKKMQ